MEECPHIDKKYKTMAIMDPAEWRAQPPIMKSGFQLEMILHIIEELYTQVGPCM